MPRRFLQVLGLENGSAVVLGFASPQLVEIRADGSVASLEHPPAGTLLHAAVRESELWVVGTEALLKRGSTGNWGRAAFAVRQLDPATQSRSDWRGAEVVPLLDGTAALFRTLKNSKDEPVGQVVLVNRDMSVESERAFPRVLFRSGVTDPSGTLWALVEVASNALPLESNASLGYLRFREGSWIIWQLPGASEWPLPGFESRRASLPIFFEGLASNERGGAYGFGTGGLYEIDERGDVNRRPLSWGKDGEAELRKLAFEPISKKFTVLAGGDGTGRKPLRLAHFDAAGLLSDSQDLSAPDWFAEAEFKPSFTDPSLSVEPTHTWVSAGPLLFALKRGSDALVYSSPKVRQEIQETALFYVREDFWRWASPILSAFLVLVIGAFSASRIRNREPFRWTCIQALAGAALSLVPALALDRHSPAGAGNSNYNSLMLFTGGALAAPFLGALGVWLAGVIRESRAPPWAFAGALLGAFLGMGMAVYLSAWIFEAPRDFHPSTLGLTVGLISGAATLGYHAISRKTPQ